MPKRSTALIVKVSEAVRTGPARETAVRNSPPNNAAGSMPKWSHPRQRGLTEVASVVAVITSRILVHPAVGEGLFGVGQAVSFLPVTVP